MCDFNSSAIDEFVTFVSCSSRAHASKSQGEDPSSLGLLDEDGGSLGGSDIDDKELSNSGSEIVS